MTSRYVTEKEKAGQLRRQADYRRRLAEKGLKARQILVTDAEDQRLRAILAVWREEDVELPDDQLAACLVLKP